jgi:hypothetical protein
MDFNDVGSGKKYLFVSEDGFFFVKLAFSALIYGI